jgi:hypothetical protein
MVDRLADLWARYAEIKEVFRGAASSGEPQLRQWWKTSERERLVGARAFITTLTEKSPLRKALDVQSATDLMWCLMASQSRSTNAGPRRRSRRRFCRREDRHADARAPEEYRQVSAPHGHGGSI